MHVQFNRPATVAGQHYNKGVHQVPNGIEKDWFFEALKSAGDIQVLSGPVQVSVAANLSEQAAKDAAVIVENSKKK